VINVENEKWTELAEEDIQHQTLLLTLNLEVLLAGFTSGYHVTKAAV
jgi:hypothetical protein